jgi:hypothetical protein
MERMTREAATKQAPAAANPEDNLYEHIERAEALRQQLATLADEYLREARTIEALENQLRLARGEFPLTNNLDDVLLRVTSLDMRTLPPLQPNPN